MKIQCRKCGHTEETDLDLIVKILGSAMPVGGYLAWTAYLFAGTGFAMGIVLAIIAGGTAMLAYKNEIVDWIINKDYKCEKCGAIDWRAIDQNAEEEQNKIKPMDIIKKDKVIVNNKIKYMKIKNLLSQLNNNINESKPDNILIKEQLLRLMNLIKDDVHYKEIKELIEIFREDLDLLSRDYDSNNENLRELLELFQETFDGIKIPK